MRATSNLLWKRPCRRGSSFREVPAEPWEPEAWHEQELAVQRRLLSTAKILPREMAELEIKQMVHIGGGQYLRADDPTLVKQEGATLTGQPSSSSALTSAVQPLLSITTQEIMGHTVFRAPTRQERRTDEAMDQEFEDIISCRREDDHVIAEMLGITSDLDSTTTPCKGRRGRHRRLLAPLRFEGPWLNVKELLDWVEKKRPKMHLGVRGLLHIAQTDNKQRFQFRGRFRDPRCDYIGQAYYPIWVSAGHGHHRALADRLDDSSIATEWISHYSSKELVGKYATFEGRR